MRKWLLMFALLSITYFGCGKADTSETAHSNHDTTMQHTSGHSGMQSGSMEERMQAMNAEMVQHLGQADAEYDHRFIDMMIPHHEGAIMMAKDALQKSQRPEIKKLAEDIIAAQEREIAQLKAWGEEWYHKH